MTVRMAFHLYTPEAYCLSQPTEAQSDNRNGTVILRDHMHRVKISGPTLGTQV